MAKSLDFIKQLNKEYDVKASHEVALEDRRSFVEQQIFEMQKMLWRGRVDVLLASALMNDKNEDLQARGQQQNREARATLKPVILALNTLEGLLKDL